MAPTAVILCGGKGTRLAPVIGPDLPKCLASVAGKPFLSYVLDHLGNQGVRKAVLCVGHKAGHVINAFGGEYYEMTLEYSLDRGDKGTAHALHNALCYLDTDPVLVLNGDTYCPFHIETLDGYYMSDFGVRLLRQDGVFSGVSLLPKEFFEWPDPTEGPCTKVYSGTPFLDIGTPEGYAQAESFLRFNGVIS